MEANCLRLLARSLAYQSMRRHIDETKLDICEITLTREEISFFHLSTNAVLSFCFGGKRWYFRECSPLMKGDAFWRREIDGFFDSLDRLHIHEEHFAQEIPISMAFDAVQIGAFRAYLERKYRDGDFRRALRSADQTARKLRFSIWENGIYDRAFFESFAMGDLPPACRGIAVYFLWNMRAAADRRRTQGIVRGKRYSFFSAVKAMASQVVAQELGMEEKIPASKWCRISTDGGRTYFGVLSASAPGCRMADLHAAQQCAPLDAGSLQRELLDLNLLDAVCCQMDHGPNNYSVVVGPSGRCRVCAFDNDHPQTFFPWMTAAGKLAGCAPLVGKDGGIHRPHLARKTAEKLMHVDIKRLKRRLKPYINGLQTAAVVYRIRALQRAVGKTGAENPAFLLDDTQWNEETAAREAGGEYGRTYLSRLNKGGSGRFSI